MTFGGHIVYLWPSSIICARTEKGINVQIMLREALTQSKSNVGFFIIINTQGQIVV